ncbi:hypothetical protein LTR97_009404 [Elasticomyces elasticus]|uniref:Threonine/serine exporter-like N-terminal domain-containing protein n=1 Tax=Elasticomyces elasticus TaxID=574655 RepID=A0AAN7VWL0_9PEZI|nr:hypothetical protein LTR97_009404 [Elasticomyces elasticus]
MSSPVDTSSNPFHDAFSVAQPSIQTPEARDSSHDTSGMVSSVETSRPGSPGGRRREKKRVGFTGGADLPGRRSRVNSFGEHPAGPDQHNLSPPRATPPIGSPELSGHSTPTHFRQGSGDLMLPDAELSSSKSHLPMLSPQVTQELHQAFSTLHIPRPRPAIRRTPSDHRGSLVEINVDPPDDYDGLLAHRKSRAQAAHERAKKLETEQSQPNSRYNSPERGQRTGRARMQPDDIPLEDMEHQFNGADSDSDADVEMPKRRNTMKPSTAEAFALVRKHTMGRGRQAETPPSPGTQSGAVTPIEEQGDFEFYRPHPKEYRGGVLGSLMKLYDQQRPSNSRSSSAQPLHRRGMSSDFSAATTPTHSPPESGASTPGGTNWFSRKHRDHSSPSLAKLIGSSASLGSPVVSGLGEQVSQRLKEQADQEKARRPGLGKRTRSGNAFAALNRISRPRIDEEIRITVHIEQYLERQKYLLKLCRALMLFGAPTHRLEEYMNMSARVLEIQAQFLYIPGSMIMSFDDPGTHTTEVKLVRVTQGLDLGKLRDVHEVYKEVVHDRIGVEDATRRLNEVLKKKDKHTRLLRIPVYGLAAACVGPFAFGARLIDLPIAFILGCILGLLQLVVAPKSDLYANVFEIAATVITSFLARAFGSIKYANGERIFCFSALAQSSIALILPGYIVLCASLELQSRSIVAGSIRMVYAIIYSLFLGFGITIGTAIYGIMDKDATSATECVGGIAEPYYFPFVPAFAMTLIIINQAKWKQAPVMLVIAFVGYIVSHYSSSRFAGNTQVSSTLGALAIGVMANLYSRVGAKIENRFLDLWEDSFRHYWKTVKTRILHLGGRAKTSVRSMEEGSAHEVESLYVRQTRRVGYGLAAAAMLPAIFVQVPSGLAVSGSLISGIASANQIAGNATNGTTVVNSTTLALGSDGLNSIAFNVSYSVVQVAIGITVGLFLSAIVVYPFGKKRSGLFSF